MSKLDVEQLCYSGWHSFAFRPGQIAVVTGIFAGRAGSSQEHYPCLSVVYADGVSDCVSMVDPANPMEKCLGTRQQLEERLGPEPR